METTAYIGLSRQVALSRRLEVIAHNIANAATTGYRAEAMLFEPVPHDAGDRQRLLFVQDVGLVRDLSEGPMRATGNPLDLAIQGSGYFVVDTPGGERYGRSGQFRLSAAFELVTAAGHPVLDEGGAPLVLPENAGAIAVARDGTVSAGDAIVGRLQVVAFANEQALEKVGDGLYRSPEEAPEPAAGFRIVQGMLEDSNVRPILEITAMMETLRAFQGVQRLLETQHELQRRAIERMLEVSA
jgi:flagellar basal-body rod protein FlgF